MTLNKAGASGGEPVPAAPSLLTDEPRERRREEELPSAGWFGLLLILLLAMAAVEHLKPKVANEIQSGSIRLGWYFHSNQWLADVRTFAAACEFVMRDDSDAAGQPTSPNIQSATPDSEHPPTAPSRADAGQQLLKDS